MSAAYVLSPAAQNDIDTAAEDLADYWDDADAADAHVDRIYDELDRLAASQPARNSKPPPRPMNPKP